MSLAETRNWIQHREAQAFFQSRHLGGPFVTVYGQHFGLFEQFTLLPILIGQRELEAVFDEPMWNRLSCSKRKPKLVLPKGHEFLSKALLDDYPGFAHLGSCYKDRDGRVIARWMMQGRGFPEIKIRTEVLRRFLQARGWAILLAISATRYSERELFELNLTEESRDFRGDGYVYRLSFYESGGRGNSDCARLSTGANCDGKKLQRF